MPLKIGSSRFSRYLICAAFTGAWQAEVERDAAIAQAALASAEARHTAMHEQRLSELKELRDRMEAETNKARSELAEWKACPWWQRLAS